MGYVMERVRRAVHMGEHTVPCLTMLWHAEWRECPLLFSWLHFTQLINKALWQRHRYTSSHSSPTHPHHLTPEQSCIQRPTNMKQTHSRIKTYNITFFFLKRKALHMHTEPWLFLHSTIYKAQTRCFRALKKRKLRNTGAIKTHSYSSMSRWKSSQTLGWQRCLNRYQVPPDLRFSMNNRTAVQL